MMTGKVEFIDVILEVEGRRFLDGVTWQLSPGQSAVVGGAPGSGKSFFPRLILGLPGLQEADHVRMWGDVLLDGVSLYDMDRDELIEMRRSIGTVMAGGGLIDNMDVERNITLPLAYHGGRTLASETAQQLQRVVRMMELNDLLRPGLRPVALNREEKMRVAIARALLSNPRILMVDELLTGLDRTTSAALVDILTGPQEVGGRLFTSSSLRAFLDRVDRFWLLEQGKIIDLGDSESVRRHNHPWVQNDLATTA